MSVDYCCKIWYGIELDIQQASNYREITKYKEDTGEPYPKVISTITEMVGDRKWDELREKLRCLEHDSWDMVEYIDEYDFRGVGIELSEVDKNCTDEIPEPSKEMKRELKKALFQLEIKQKPKIFVTFGVY